MVKIKNLGEVYIRGEIINLNTASPDNLENKIQELEIEEKNIKSQIFSILETF